MPIRTVRFPTEPTRYDANTTQWRLGLRRSICYDAAVSYNSSVQGAYGGFLLFGNLNLQPPVRNSHLRF